jgi:hypothetical protein
MELTSKEEKAIKAIYSDYHENIMNADEAMFALEQVINGLWEEKGN